MNLRLANFTLFSDLSWLWRASYVGVGLTALGLVLLYKNQNYLLYIPNPPGLPRTPRDNPPGYQAPSQWTTSGSVLSSLPTSKAAQDSPSNAIHYEEEMLVTKDGVKIHVWVMLQPDHPSNNKYPTLIYFHGNAGNMGFRLPNAVHMFARSKLNIVMMDYRGYGSSSGEPNEEGLNLDADTVLEFVSKHPKLSSSPIFLFGRSLGGAVSVALAHRHPDLVAGIVLENTFLSISTMVDILMPWLSWIKKFVLRINWDSHLKIQQLTQPILFISGDADMLVPPVHMKSLYDLAIRSRMKDFYSVAGGTHNDTWEVAGAQYYRRLKAFIDAALLDDRKDNTCSSNAEDDSTPESELKRINSDVVLP